MAQDYKITAVSQQVKDWQSNYGPMKTYKLMLEGRTEACEINKKADSAPPTVGQVLYGNITTNEYGDKIKTEQKQPGFGTPPPDKQGVRVDNSDGQRQGMCINNAAAYVIAVRDPKAGVMTPTDWAEIVHGYATALYALGDLNAKEEEKPVTVDDIQDPFDDLPADF